MFKIFEIREGKFTAFPQLSPKKIKGFFIISAVIAIISLLSGWLNISEKQLWKYYQLLLEQLNLKYELPELKNNQDKLDARVELEVDRALAEATAEYDRIIAEADKNKYKPRYVDGVNDEAVCYTDECKTLAPPMRLCAPWVDDCPKE
jgi:uncharacterized membrane protein